MSPTSTWLPFVRILMLVLLLFQLQYAAASAQTFVVQGSTTFAQVVMVPYQKAIEASSGHKLTVVPNKSSIGLLALRTAHQLRNDFWSAREPSQTAEI